MNEAKETHLASAPQPVPDMRLLESEALRMLASGVDENDVLLHLCERTGWTWPVAQDYLRRLATDRRQELARRRLPLATVISLAALAVGAVLLGACFFGLHDVAVAVWHARRPEDLAHIFGLVLLQLPTVELAILGAAMITGGAIGLARAAADLSRGG